MLKFLKTKKGKSIAAAVAGAVAAGLVMIFPEKAATIFSIADILGDFFTAISAEAETVTVVVE